MRVLDESQEGLKQLKSFKVKRSHSKHVLHSSEAKKDFLHDRVALVSGRTLLSEGSEFLSFLQLITAGRTSATCVKVQLRWISSRTQTWTKGYRRGHRLDMEIVKRI